MAKPKPTKMLAVLGRSRRTGRWRLAARSTVLSVLGSCYLDMTNSFVDDKEKLRMTVTVFLGSATFILPDGAEVRPSGNSVLAASMVDVPDHDDTSELPTLNIEWTCVFGRIRILSEDAAARLEAEQRQKRLEKAIKKGKASPDEIIEVSEAAPAKPLAAPAPAAAAATPASAQPAAPDPEPVVAGVGFDDLPAAGADDAQAEPVVAGVGFDDLPAAGADDAQAEPVVAGVGFDDLPAADDEPVVAGVGFDDLPAADDEPVVAGVGFDDLPAADDEPVVAGVGFDDLPAADDEPVVTGVGFDDLPDDSGSAAADAAEEDAIDADDEDVDSEARPSVDVGFIDMEYDPEAANAAV